MRRTTIALLAALEASVAALIGLGIVLVPLMLLWAVHFGLAVDAAVFLRAAADVWLLGHGVDLVVQLDPVTAGRIALPGAGDPFPITIALLGFALITVAFGRRIGRRSAAGGHSFSGGIAAVVVFALAGAGLALAAGVDAARADPLAGRADPGRHRGASASCSARSARCCAPTPPTDAATGVVRRALAALPAGPRRGRRAAVRIGAGAAFGVLALAAVLVAVLIALDYATIAGLYQALGAGVDGGIALTVAELALLPNIVIWAAAWLLGPGFAIGTGSLVSTGGHAARPGARHPAARRAADRRPGARRALARRARAARVRRRVGGVGRRRRRSRRPAQPPAGGRRSPWRPGRPPPPRSCWASSPGGRAVRPDRGASPTSGPCRSPSRASPRPRWASARSSAATPRASAGGEPATPVRPEPARRRDGGRLRALIGHLPAAVARC